MNLAGVTDSEVSLPSVRFARYPNWGCFMSNPIVLTGLSHGKHKFTLNYPEVDGKKICIALCVCGYEVEIDNFHNYGGIKDLQMKWEKHIGTWKGWV